MSDKPGSLLGGTLLIAGSCVGGGILALPIVTGLCGFYPSLLIFVGMWAFMTLNGLLLVEVNGWFGAKKVNLITMIGHSIGSFGRALGWLIYLFLFYSLLVAYNVGSGGLVSSFFARFFSLSVESWVGSLFFVLLLGGVLYFGLRTVDLWNRVLMVGKICAYLGLVIVGASHVSSSLLSRADLHYLFYSLPVMVIAFGFHNMIPTITNYMKGDLKRVKKAIVMGSLFALAVYLIWDLIVLGILPKEGEYGILSSLRSGREAAQAIAGILGSSWVSGFAQVFGFFALVASLLMQSLALIHFWVDGLQMKTKKPEPLSICLLTLLPPFLFSALNPQIFFKAIDFAGGICAILLFGIIPVVMVWMGRYRKQTASTYQVKGGKPLLVAILLISLFIMLFQISLMAGWLTKLSAT